MSKQFKALFPFAAAILLASCNGPTASSSAPSASSEGKSETSVKSEEKSSEAPVESSVAPVESSGTPTESSTKGSGDGSKTPGESSEAPVESSEAPVESSEAPVSSEQGGDGPVVKEPVTIYFWNGFNDNYRAVISNVIAAFKEIEPNITVEHDDIKQSGNYEMIMNNIIQGFSANNYPDITVGYPDSVQRVLNAGKALDLTEYIENPVYGWTDDDLEDVIEAYQEEGRSYSVEGCYSMPFCKSTEVMYYNASIEGLDLSAIDATINGGNPINEDYLNNLTWEDFWDHLIPAFETYNNGLDDDKKIVGTDAKYPCLVGYDSADNLFISLAEQYGYGYTDIDPITGEGQLLFVNEGMKGLVAKYREYYKKGWFQTQGTSGSYTSKLFQPGNALFCIGSTAGVSNQNGSTFQTKVCNLPKPAQGKRAVINQGPSMIFFDHNDDQRALASWLFYNFLTNPDNGAAWALNTGYMPIRYSTYDTRAYTRMSTIEGKPEKSLDLLKAYQAQYQLEVSPYLFVSPVFTGSSEARTQVGSIINTACTDDTKTIDEIFQTAYENTLKQM